MTERNQRNNQVEPGAGSQSTEDEPIQHGPLSGDNGKSRPSEGIEIKRTSVGEHPNVPDLPMTQTPDQGR